MAKKLFSYLLFMRVSSLILYFVAVHDVVIMRVLLVNLVFLLIHLADPRWLSVGTIHILGLAAGCLVSTLTHSRLFLFSVCRNGIEAVFSVQILNECSAWIFYTYLFLDIYIL